MASRRRKSLAAAGLLALAAGSYFIYNLMAAQGQGVLAQAPLNTQIQVPPAFIMAVDDSNSMTFERLFPGGDGRMQWNSANSSFFANNGSFSSIGTNCQTGNNFTNEPDCYLYLFPHSGYNTSYSPGRAIPPFSTFGFARSHARNAGYFNPGVTYEPWRNSDGSLWADASATAARADPRDSGTYGASFATAYGVTYDLTAERRVNGEVFSVLTGMVIPAGTVYRSNARSCNSNNSNGLPSTSNSWASSGNSSITAAANCTVQIAYFPATFYLPAADAAPVGYRAGDAFRPQIAGACGPGCDLRRYEIKSGNYLTTQAYDAAIQNYANWFQYHRSRLLAMVGAMTHSMQTVNNMRVGYFTINNRVNVTMHDVTSARSSLYNNFFKLQAGGLVNAGGGTPNRDAVSHLGEQFRRSGAEAPIALACQRNAGMLFTDGFTNSGNGPTNIGNIDRNLGAPFADSWSDTIPDIASLYYLGSAQDGLVPLRTGGDFPTGQVPIPDACWTDKAAGVLNPNADKRLNCQPNLHMNFYGVTLGAQGAIYGVNQASTNDPFANTPNWNAAGNPRNSDGPPTVDEIWHAAINTRGEFINAKTPADITAAMRRILLAVSAGASPSGSLSVSGARIGQGSLAVTPEYEVTNEGTDWFSRLIANKVSINATTGAIRSDVAWEASTRFPAVADRNVWYASGSDVNKYSADTLSLAALCDKDASLYPGMSRCTVGEVEALGAAVNQNAAREYLLGDVSREKRNGGPFRNRTSILGDIVNSTPVISAPTDDYGYDSLPVSQGGGNSGVGSYGEYLETKKSDRRYMVYVGANDGMFHAFDGGMNASGTIPNGDTLGGRERFAYIPSTAVGHLGNLLFPYNAADQNNQKFSHKYYVDGPIAVGDARYDGNWETVVVGAAGAGGRGVFALDVSDPTSFGVSNRLWEISDLMVGSSYVGARANIGHVLGRPVIAPVKRTDGTVVWKAIFGNGYNSASGKAVLFLVDIGTGDPSIQMIEAAESGNAIAGSNGLGNIVVVDRWTTDPSTTSQRNNLDGAGSDGFADTVYAADQKGAIWKFDLRAPSPPNQQRPLFTSAETTSGGSTYRQPITGGLLATAGPSGGVMLYFGTGSFSFTTDPGDKSVQALYAIVDPLRGAPTSTILPGHLVARSIQTTTAGVRTISTAVAPTLSRGWRLTLPAGERFVGYPSVATGIVFLPTYAPQETATGCSTQGFNWLYGLNATSGAAAFSSARAGSTTGTPYAGGVAAIALDTGGSAPVRDVGVLALPRANQGAGGSTGVGEDGATPPSPPSQGCWMAVTAAGAAVSYVPYPCGRQSWRQIQ